MKGLKIFNIILFSLICALEIVIIGTYINFVVFLSSNSFGGIFGVLFSVVYYLAELAGLFVLNIVITITEKCELKKLEESNLQTTKFNKLCIILPWILFVVDILLFISFFSI